MSEFLEILKITGPGYAILIYLVIHLWRDNKRKDDKIFGLYDRLLDEKKSTSISSPQLPGYTEFLLYKMESLKNEIDKVKQQSDGKT